jgi:uncharacterized protein YjbJ (UPF0337 family)
MIKGSIKVAKGRIEEAAGALAGSNTLRDKGRADQAKGRVQKAGEQGVRKAKASARRIVDKAKDAAHDAADKATSKKPAAR